MSENLTLLDPISLSLVVLALPLLSFVAISLSTDDRLKVVIYSVITTLFFLAIGSLVITTKVWSTPIFVSIPWFQLGNEIVSVGVSLDRWTGIMLFIVCFISFLVHLFSIEYMKGDKSLKRYFAILSLFTFSMVGIVISDSLLIIFIFWELVGFCSYLLIGHWFKKSSAARASKKAFIVNRIGDVGFIIALGFSWFYFNTFSLSEIELIFSQTDGNNMLGFINSTNLTLLGILFFIAAMGKSAQFPLQVWLPDAMEGPTPASALIHAATMVAAGVYLLSRIFFLLSAEALVIVALIGSITAFMGAVAAMNQTDIKKVLAFSTVSQLGYMVLGIGVGSYQSALFHLFTHAFFKAGLFLGAGAIIYHLHNANHEKSYDAQDMALMGGLRTLLPTTFYTYLIFSLSLIGVPLFSGFLSKDAILLNALLMAESYGGLYVAVVVLAFISVALTSFYIFRQLYLVFFGEYRGGNMSLIKEDSPIMKFVLISLAIFSVGLLWSVNPFNLEEVWILSGSVTDKLIIDIKGGITPNGYGTGVPVISGMLISIGFFFATFFYRPSVIADSKAVKIFRLDGILSKLSYNNWYLDAIYHSLIIKPFMALAHFLRKIEYWVIDRFVNLMGWFTVIAAHIIAWFDRACIDGIINLSVYTVGRAGVITKSIQGNSAQSYIIWAIIGILIMLFLAL